MVLILVARAWWRFDARTLRPVQCRECDLGHMAVSVRPARRVAACRYRVRSLASL